MRRQILGLFGTGLGLTGLYLVLERAGGARQILDGLGAGVVNVFRVLQGRG